ISRTPRTRARARPNYRRGATIRSRTRSATSPTIAAVSRMDRHLHRTVSRSTAKVSGAKIRNPNSVCGPHEAHLRGIERARAGPRLEGHGGALGELVKPAIAYGVAAKRVRLAVLATHRPGAAVALQLQDGARHLNVSTDTTSRTGPFRGLLARLRPE